MTRKEFPVAVKKAAFQRSLIDGECRCEVVWHGKRCGKLILGAPEYDHIVPDGLQGEPTLENCQCACRACHKIKTHMHDRPVMAKADRSLKSNRGIKRKHVWPKRKFGQ